MNLRNRNCDSVTIANCNASQVVVQVDVQRKSVLMSAIINLFGDVRRAAPRHVIDHVAETRFERIPGLKLHLGNISSGGFMTTGGPPPVERGEVLLVRLPVVVWRPCLVAWVFEDRAGFQFRQPIPDEPFQRLLAALLSRDGAKPRR